MPRITLPKKDDDLRLALESELLGAETESNLHLTGWRLADAYLSGVRKFSVQDRFSGRISIAYENIKGDLEFRHEEILRMLLVEAGRWMKADINPFVGKKGESLGAMRAAGVANAVLSSRAKKLPLKTLKRRLIVPFLKYGTVGIQHYETGDPRFPDLVEPVHPRQLRGLPAWVDGIENLYGVARKRWVPLEWFKERVKSVYNKDIGRYHPEADLMGRAVTWGTQPPQTSWFWESGAEAAMQFPLKMEDSLPLDIGRGRTHKSRQMVSQTKPDQDVRWYVPMEEIYIYDDSQMYVDHFVLKCGDKIIVSERFFEQNLKVVCPLHAARHTDIGRMYGRSWLSPLLPFNDQIEKMYSSLFKNIRELDMFGTLFISGGMSIDTKRWRTGPRPRIEKYEVDPLNPGAQPMTLQPHNTGTLPGKFAEIASEKLQQLSGQGPAYSGEAAGRVDSAAGLGFLFNTGNVSLGLPSHGFADAMAGIYSRILQVTKETVGTGATMDLAVVDDAVAGVIVDPQSGQVSLDDNPIPDPWDVEVDIRDRQPRDPLARKQELRELYAAGLVDWTQFWITAFEEDLDFPGAPKEIWETWRKAIWQIILLFRDGKEPGPMILGEHTQDANVQLIALQRFMNRIEYSLASREVKEEFENWKQMLERLTGQNYPVGLPPPEEVAQERMAQEQQQQAAGGNPLAGLGL